MGKQKAFFARLRELVFGPEVEAHRASPPGDEIGGVSVAKLPPAKPPEAKPRASDAPATAPAPSSPAKPAPSQRPPAGDGKLRKSNPKRDPYFIQIGFDFGTSFSKCVYRDLSLNRAWVVQPPQRKGAELPFLMPSTVRFKNGTLSYSNDCSRHYSDDCLYHLKMALEKVGLCAWKDPALVPYQKASCACNPEGLADFVRSCVVYYLAGCLGTCKEEIRKRYPTFGQVKGDHMAVNMALPVADAQQSKVRKEFQRALGLGWMLADDLSGHPPIALDDLTSLCEPRLKELETESLRDTCYVYPEVSANMMGFVKSQASARGVVYLFSDAGAGTVDQSVFICVDRNGEPHLTYLGAAVLPLGSSQIEYRAARSAGDLSAAKLEALRLVKESGDTNHELGGARKSVETELKLWTRSTLYAAKQRLPVAGQLDDTRVIFGGGGHCKCPYASGATAPFQGDLFLHPFIPATLGQPTPNDLELSNGQGRWVRRLSVAYGLSFYREELASFTYPSEVPHAVRRVTHVEHHAPSKDEC